MLSLTFINVYQEFLFLLVIIFTKFQIFKKIVDKSLGSVIRLGKDITDKWSQNNIVYEFDCNNCSATYIGEKKRTLKTRISEHKRTKNQESVVLGHQIAFNHTFNFDEAKIIDYEPNYKKRIISEMIHIKCKKRRLIRKKIFSTLVIDIFLY